MIYFPRVFWLEYRFRSVRVGQQALFCDCRHAVLREPQKPDLGWRFGVLLYPSAVWPWAPSTQETEAQMVGAGVSASDLGCAQGTVELHLVHRQCLWHLIRGRSSVLEVPCPLLS